MMQVYYKHECAREYVNRRMELVGRYIGGRVEGVPRGRVT